MELRYLLDTSTVIKYFHPTPILSEKALVFIDAIIDSKPTISIITRIELLSKGDISAEEENLINELIKHSKVIDLTESIALKVIQLRRKYKIKTPDAIIAATAIVYECTLVADNDDDFRKLISEGLLLINPRSLT